MSQIPIIAAAWRRCSLLMSGLSPGARARLGLGALPLAALWALQAAPGRFAVAEGLLAIAVFALMKDVVAGGLHDAVLHRRITQDALAAMAAWIGFSCSFLIAALDAAGRMPRGLEDGGGEPLLFFAPAATIVAARFAGREAVWRLLPSGLPAPGDRHPTPGEARLASRACAVMAASMTLVLGATIPLAIWRGGASAAPSLMAALAGFSPEVVRLALVLARKRAASLLPEEDPCHAFESFDACSRTQAVIFEKGGVLTADRPEVVQVHALCDGWSREDVLHLAAVAEYGAHHPIREAILKSYKANLRTIPSLKHIRLLPGRGIRATYQGRDLCLGNLRLFEEASWGREVLSDLGARAREWASRGETVLFLSLGKEIIGGLCLQDPLRHGCGEALERLTEIGIRVEVLSGDPQTLLAGLPANAAAEVHGGVLPEERLQVLERLRSEGLFVSAVGTRAFLASWGAQADFCFLWPEGARGAPRAPRLEVPGRSFSLTKKNLVEVPERIAQGRRIVESRRRCLWLVGAHHALALPVLAGALEPLTGLGPAPALAAVASAVLSAVVFLACGRVSP